MEAGSIMPTRVFSRSFNPVQDVEMEECHRSSTADRHREDFAPPHAVNITTNWNESKSTLWRVTATFWCMLVMGANDAAYGAILPYVCLAITSLFFSRILANSNEVLGFLHGFYGAGATCSPIIVTTLITKARWERFSFYYIMVGAAMIELFFAVSAFWEEKGLRHGSESSNRGGTHPRTRHALTYKITWACAIFLFIYGGIEVDVGGWVVIFMKSVRHGNAFASGMTETGFWLGITLGRFTLGLISPRLGERLSIAIYLIISICLELLFWLVPQFLVSAFAVSLIGFFTGPIFPGVVVVATRLLPKDIQVPAIGFAAAMAMGGGSVFPFIIGAIAQAKGVDILQPFMLAMLTGAGSMGSATSLFCIVYPQRD